MRFVLTSVIWLALLIPVVNAEELSREEQVSIIADYMLITGQGGLGFQSASDDSEETRPLKCGTSAVLNFVTNYDKLDPELLKSLGVELETRPEGLDEFVDSPLGLFRIHYTNSGIDALEGGTPTAIKIADIMDSVYTHIIDTLGYPPPPQDGYEPGGDEKYDVYMRYLGPLFYGLTWTDSLEYPTTQQATSFIEMNARPSTIYSYNNDPHAPLDAIRVTAAHEYFHAVQFGIDWGEAEYDIGGKNERRYWMEASSTWMEEEIYDDINDYYSYLETFYNRPEASLQQQNGGNDLHPYACVVYPIFLTEKYGRDIVRDIWLLCGSMGFGADFLSAADSAIMMASGRTQNWETAFSEFALWNYLTGERANLTMTHGLGFAPDLTDSLVVGYSEKENYPAIPYNKVHSYYAYPITVLGGENQAESPRVNGSYYLRLEQISSATIVDDTTFWVCDTAAGEFVDGCDTCCTDSIFTRDTLDYGFPYYSYRINVDSLFNIYLALRNPYSPAMPEGWGVNVIYEFVDAPDSLVVDRFFAPDTGLFASRVGLLDHTEYSSLTFVITPAPVNNEYYARPDYRIQWVGYLVGENSYIDSLRSMPAAVLDPYPNPMIVSEMDDPHITFKLRVPFDTGSFPMYGQPFTEADPVLQVDIYTVAGERIRTLGEITWREARFGEFFTEWDLTNESGADVAAGVYLVYARLFSKARRGSLLAEDHSKVLVIR